jgi:hypothetical protein
METEDCARLALEVTSRSRAIFLVGLQRANSGANSSPRAYRAFSQGPVPFSPGDRRRGILHAGRAGLATSSTATSPRRRAAYSKRSSARRPRSQSAPQTTKPVKTTTAAPARVQRRPRPHRAQPPRIPNTGDRERRALRNFRSKVVRDDTSHAGLRSQHRTRRSASQIPAIHRVVSAGDK